MSHGQSEHQQDAETPEHTNRLIHETSPYLLQHAHNPVEWYPWGPEAFERARQDDKPLVLSVGYAACHWCHVMAHESFENEDTARLMNDNFVNIKVDREERPDVDALYMDAVQAMTGRGGWPMTVFLTPDGAPFFAGTYFPPRDRYGMPGFPTVLRQVAHFYKTRRDEVEQQAQAFRDYYRQQGERAIGLPRDLLAGAPAVSPETLETAAQRLLESYDTIRGGFGGAPKFPHPMDLDFLLRVALRVSGEERERYLAPVLATLDAMANGGIYDQVGGGFHRYATDAIWLVPHFEKMLYDNALLAPVYLHAWQMTGADRYRRVCEDILDYVQREMTDPAGGFYSTQDADSEGEEGKFYVWTPDEIRTVLDAQDAEIAMKRWGVTPGGNFAGRNILYAAQPPRQIADELHLPVARVEESLARSRQALYAARAKRVWPARDDKVLTSWNGLMQRAFAEAGRVLDRQDYRAAAAANADFLLATMVTPDGVLRAWRNGQSRISGFLEDFAAVANALLSTYEATGETRYFVAARTLCDEILARFWDTTTRTFYDTGNQHEALIGRPRELTDNALPSGTSLASEALLRLAAFTGEERYREHAAQVLLALTPAMREQPLAFGHLLAALDDFIGPLYEVAIVSPSPEHPGAMLRALANVYQPRLALAFGPASDAAESPVPLLTGRGPINGEPAAYVCQNFVCNAPVTDPPQLAQQVRG